MVVVDTKKRNMRLVYAIILVLALVCLATEGNDGAFTVVNAIGLALLALLVVMMYQRKELN